VPPAVHAVEARQRDPILQAAMNLVKEKNYAAAIDMVTQSLAQGKLADTYEAHLFLGAAYYKSKQYDNAGMEFDKTVAIDKTSRMSYWFLGHIYEAKALKTTVPDEQVALKTKALEAWQNFLQYPRSTDALPLSQKHIGISVEESTEQAKKHIKMLEGELHHE
jgi:tetratricopeptide (TPR) repeat protein